MFAANGPEIVQYQSDRRGPRSRANLPVPVPNLTKKSRGRRVPTAQPGVQEELQKEKRTYMCTVEDCGKCFHRGEHLKRHIRSIHTHDKPFKCEQPGCGKFFNRHDNLLQHLKVHTHTRRPTDQTESLPGLMNPPTNSPHPPPTSSNLIAALKYAQPQPYNTGEDMFTKTTMAVSSARTEIPPTPPRSQSQNGHDMGGLYPSLPPLEQMTYGMPPPRGMWEQHQQQQQQHYAFVADPMNLLSGRQWPS
ncbi:hypothetical protein BDZ89DRAFT_962337 [Hymenopellis radicata]|nr:hypothetical protein BDZ89DRAFT_962337 [Hymenopellis radicata]